MISGGVSPGKIEFRGRMILFGTHCPCATFMHFGLQIEVFDSRFMGQDRVVSVDDEEEYAETMPRLKT